jgi:hypothetical protein
MPRLLALVGILMMFAGLHLLWLARRGIFYWLEIYARVFVQRLRNLPHSPLVLDSPAPRERHTLRIAVGMALVFFIGPVLIALGLVL